MRGPHILESCLEGQGGSGSIYCCVEVIWAPAKDEGLKVSLPGGGDWGGGGVDLAMVVVKVVEGRYKLTACKTELKTRGVGGGVDLVVVVVVMYTQRCQVTDDLRAGTCKTEMGTKDAFYRARHVLVQRVGR
jgi:hypothetical protein